jgi:hypothetical protein
MMTATGREPAEVASLADIVREVSRGGLAALVAGVLFGGVGGRIAMRISALMDPSAGRRMTEAGARVGEITLGGTISFVIFVGIFTGIGLALIWVVVQRWLPTNRGYRYSAGAVIGIAMGGRFAIDGRNVDFLILGPKAGQVGIFLLLAAMTGVAVVGIDGRLERSLPRQSSAALAGYWAIAGLGLLATVPGLTLLFTNGGCQCVSPPRLPGAALIAVAGWTLWAWIAEYRRVATPPWLEAAARSSVFAMVVAGLIHLGGEIAHFM